MHRRGLGPCALVAVVVVTTWLLTGVAVDEIARFVAYELVFVALPGIALLWALRGRRPRLLIAIAIGWPLGQVQELFAFTATATANVRGLYFLYPIVVIALSALVIARRSHGPEPEPEGESLSALVLWASAAVLSVGLTYLALMFLPAAPLPSTAPSVAYSADFPYFIGLIAQVTYHWPPANAGLSGVPLRYEWFVFFHMAAVTQVTHLSIPTTALRLDYVPSIVVIAVQLLAIGRYVGRSAWVGVVAIAVVFILGPLDLTTDVGGSSPFFDLFIGHLWSSWTFPYGLTFFLPLLYLVMQRVRSTSWRTPDDLATWVIIVLLMIGASGAKATVLPVIIAGTGLYALLAYAVQRTLSINAAAITVLGIIVFVITFLVVYGGGVPGTSIEPLVSLARTAPVIFAHGLTSHTLRAIAVPIAYVVGLAGMLLPLAGMLYLLRRRHHDQLALYGPALCMFVAGLLITNVVHQVGYSELYFQDTGYVAGAVAAAAGYRLVWLDAGGALPVSRRALAASFAAWVVLMLGVVAVSSKALAHPDALIARYGAFGVGTVLFVGAGLLITRWRRRRPVGAILAIGLIPMLAAAALATPIEVSPTAKRVLTRAPIPAPQPDPGTVWGLTPGLVSALHWLHDHSSVNTVFAVNNHWIGPSLADGRYYYYSAFSERQVFIEAYDPIRYGITTGLATAAGRDYARRQTLNDAVFEHGDSTALSVLVQQYGVHFLFIDRIHGTFAPLVLHLGTIVYSTPSATIVEIG